LREYPEFSAALLRVTYDPLLRKVETHLSPRADSGEDQLIRLVTWPGASVAGCYLLAVERRPMGLSKPQRFPIADKLIRVQWPGRVDRTGFAILHPELGICWWSDLLPFVRTIGIDIAMSGRRRRVEVHGLDKKQTDSYEVTERVPMHSGPTLIGEKPDELSFTSRHHRAESQRARRRQATGLRWFEDAETAAAEIRAIIGVARQYVWIIDPYFSGIELVRFALATTSPDVKVEVVTSAEHLRQRAAGRGSLERGDLLKSILEKISAKEPANIFVAVMLGATAPLHDRFLVVDGRVWLSGNSLNAIGERASVLIEVPDPDDILARLQPVKDAAVSFDQWIETRKAERGRSRQQFWQVLLAKLTFWRR
jgi:hypothetical protein